jgi:hypothetical protein
VITNPRPVRAIAHPKDKIDALLLAKLHAAGGVQSVGIG